MENHTEGHQYDRQFFADPNMIRQQMGLYGIPQTHLGMPGHQISQQLFPATAGRAPFSAQDTPEHCGGLTSTQRNITVQSSSSLPSLPVANTNPWMISYTSQSAINSDFAMNMSNLYQSRWNQQQQSSLAAPTQYDLAVQQRSSELRTAHIQQQQQEHSVQVQREHEALRERDLQIQREQEMNMQREQEAHLLREKEVQLQRERLIQMQRESQAQMMHEREMMRKHEALKRERELQMQRERDAQLQREKEAKEQRDREIQMQREREAQLKRELEAQVEKERQAKIQKEREAQMKREKEAQLKKEKEELLRKEREMLAKQEKEAQMQREAMIERNKHLEMQQKMRRDMFMQQENQFFVPNQPHLNMHPNMADMAMIHPQFNFQNHDINSLMKKSSMPAISMNNHPFYTSQMSTKPTTISTGMPTLSKPMPLGSSLLHFPQSASVTQIPDEQSWGLPQSMSAILKKSSNALDDNFLSTLDPTYKERNDRNAFNSHYQNNQFMKTFDDIDLTIDRHISPIKIDCQDKDVEKPSMHSSSYKSSTPSDNLMLSKSVSASGHHEPVANITFSKFPPPQNTREQKQESSSKEERSNINASNVCFSNTNSLQATQNSSVNINININMPSHPGFPFSLSEMTSSLANSSQINLSAEKKTSVASDVGFTKQLSVSQQNLSTVSLENKMEVRKVSESQEIKTANDYYPSTSETTTVMESSHISVSKIESQSRVSEVMSSRGDSNAVVSVIQTESKPKQSFSSIEYFLGMNASASNSELDTLSSTVSSLPEMEIPQNASEPQDRISVIKPLADQEDDGTESMEMSQDEGSDTEEMSDDFQDEDFQEKDWFGTGDDGNTADKLENVLEMVESNFPNFQREIMGGDVAKYGRVEEAVSNSEWCDNVSSKENSDWLGNMEKKGSSGGFGNSVIDTKDDRIDWLEREIASAGKGFEDKQAPIPEPSVNLFGSDVGIAAESSTLKSAAVVHDEHNSGKSSPHVQKESHVKLSQHVPERSTVQPKSSEHAKEGSTAQPMVNTQPVGVLMHPSMRFNKAKKSIPQPPQPLQPKNASADIPAPKLLHPSQRLQRNKNLQSVARPAVEPNSRTYATPPLKTPDETSVSDSPKPGNFSLEVSRDNREDMNQSFQVDNSFLKSADGLGVGRNQWQENIFFPEASISHKEGSKRLPQGNLDILKTSDEGGDGSNAHFVGANIPFSEASAASREGGNRSISASHEIPCRDISQQSIMHSSDASVGKMSDNIIPMHRSPFPSEFSSYKSPEGRSSLHGSIYSPEAPADKIIGDSSSYKKDIDSVKELVSVKKFDSNMMNVFSPEVPASKEGGDSFMGGTVNLSRPFPISDDNHLLHTSIYSSESLPTKPDAIKTSTHMDAFSPAHPPHQNIDNSLNRKDKTSMHTDVYSSAATSRQKMDSSVSVMDNTSMHMDTYSSSASPRVKIDNSVNRIDNSMQLDAYSSAVSSHEKIDNAVNRMGCSTHMDIVSSAISSLEKIESPVHRMDKTSIPMDVFPSALPSHEKIDNSVNRMGDTSTHMEAYSSAVSSHENIDNFVNRIDKTSTHLDGYSSAASFHEKRDNSVNRMDKTSTHMDEYSSAVSPHVKADNSVNRMDNSMHMDVYSSAVSPHEKIDDSMSRMDYYSHDAVWDKVDNNSSPHLDIFPSEVVTGDQSDGSLAAHSRSYPMNIHSSDALYDENIAGSTSRNIHSLDASMQEKSDNNSSLDSDVYSLEAPDMHSTVDKQSPVHDMQESKRTPTGMETEYPDDSERIPFSKMDDGTPERHSPKPLRSPISSRKPFSIPHGGKPASYTASLSDHAKPISGKPLSYLQSIAEANKAESLSNNPPAAEPPIKMEMRKTRSKVRKSLSNKSRDAEIFDDRGTTSKPAPDVVAKESIMSFPSAQYNHDKVKEPIKKAAAPASSLTSSKEKVSNPAVSGGKPFTFNKITFDGNDTKESSGSETESSSESDDEEKQDSCDESSSKSEESGSDEDDADQDDDNSQSGLNDSSLSQDYDTGSKRKETADCSEVINNLKKRKFVDEELIKLPLKSGWKRETRLRPTSSGESLRGDVYYVSPCGKKLRTYPELNHYINKNGITDIQLEHFSFSSKLWVGDFLEAKQGPKFVKLNDEEVEDRFKCMTERSRMTQERAKERKNKKRESVEKAKQLLEEKNRKKQELMEMKKRKEEERRKAIHNKALESKLKKQHEREAAREAKRLKDMAILSKKLEKKTAIEAERIAKRERVKNMLEEKRRAKEFKEKERLMKLEEQRLKKEWKQQAIENEREKKRQEMVMNKAQAKEQRRREIVMMKAYEAQRRAEERERLKEQKKLEKILLRQRKLEQKRYERLISRELKKPIDDMALKDMKPLPEMPVVPNLNIPGQAYADLLMVQEFIYSFGHVIDIDPEEDFPSMADLQASLLCESLSEDAVFNACQSLLFYALYDPGVSGKYAVTMLGVNIQNVELNEANISEVLRLFILSRTEGAPHLLSDLLQEKPLVSLSPNNKAAILAYLCNEILCGKSIGREIEANLDNMANLRRDKWTLEGEIRKLKGDILKKKPKTIDDNENGKKGDKSLSGSQRNDYEDGQGESNDEKYSDDDEHNQSFPSSTHRLSESQEEGEECEVVPALQEKDGEAQGLEQMNKKLNLLEKRHTRYRKKLFDASHSIRGIHLGQDRYKRRYFILPNGGGIYVEGWDSGYYDDEICSKTEEQQEKTKEHIGSLLTTLKGPKSSSSSPNRPLASPNRMLPKQELPPHTDYKNSESFRSTPLNIKCEPHGVSPLVSPIHYSQTSYQHPYMPHMDLNRGEHKSVVGNFSQRSICSPNHNYMYPAGFNIAQSPQLRMPSSKWFSLRAKRTCDDFKPLLRSEGFPSTGGRNIIAPTVELLSQDHTFLESLYNYYSHNTSSIHHPPFNLSSSLLNNSSSLTDTSSLLGLPPGLDINLLIQQDPQKAAELLEIQSAIPQEIPKEKKCGWWRITDAEHLQRIIKVAHPRGMRERLLQKSIIRNMDYATNSCKTENPSFSLVLPNDEGDSKDETKHHVLKTTLPITDHAYPQLAYASDKAVLIEVEELEEKVFSASLQVKGWRLSHKISPMLHLDVSQEYNPKGDEHPLYAAKTRLLALEAGLERRYLKHPFRLEKMNVVATKSESSDPTKDENLMNANIQEITPALRLWREAVENGKSSAQISMCIHLLNECVAWEKSIMKVFCILCRKSDNEERLLLCDMCDRGCHTYCCKPKLDEIPEGDWFCQECILMASGSDQCYTCKGKSGKRLKCAFCPRHYHMQCLEPPLQKTPRSPWACPVCKKARAKTKAPARKKPRVEDLIKQEETSKAKLSSRQHLHKLLEPCRDILADLENHQCSWPFLVPVNSKQFPEYYKIIKHAMDFHTMKTKLRDYVYKTRDEFAFDARLVFTNCNIFNEDDSEVGRAGKAMSNYFERRWAEMLVNAANEEKKLLDKAEKKEKLNSSIDKRDSSSSDEDEDGESTSSEEISSESESSEVEDCSDMEESEAPRSRMKR